MAYSDRAEPMTVRVMKSTTARNVAGNLMMIWLRVKEYLYACANATNHFRTARVYRFGHWQIIYIICL